MYWLNCFAMHQITPALICAVSCKCVSACEHCKSRFFLCIRVGNVEKFCFLVDDYVCSSMDEHMSSG